MKKTAAALALALGLTLAGPAPSAQADDICSPLECELEHRHAVCTLEISRLEMAARPRGTVEVICDDAFFLWMKVQTVTVQKERRVLRLPGVDCDVCVPDGPWRAVNRTPWKLSYNPHLVAQTGVRRCHKTAVNRFKVLVHIQVGQKGSRPLHGRTEGVPVVLPCWVNLDLVQR